MKQRQDGWCCHQALSLTVTFFLLTLYMTNVKESSPHDQKLYIKGLVRAPRAAC